MKVFISGISGIGKTTLAETISKKHEDMPFIIGSTKILWEKYNITSHKDIIKMCNEDPTLGMAFQMEVLDYRMEMANTHKNFISDRSPVDNIVYTLTQLSHKVSDELMLEYINKAKIIYQKPDVRHIHLGANYHTIRTKGIEDDNMRITNQYYQFMINNIFSMVLHDDWLDIPRKTQNMRVVNTWDMDVRIDAVEELMGIIK